MISGDRYTGEIKSYASGRLLVKTEDAGDASIKWNKIRSITSSKTFDVELTNGDRIFGSLTPTQPPGLLGVVGVGGTRNVEFLDVHRIAPIYQSFWRRMSGSLDVGFNYTQVNQLVQFNLCGDTTYRTRNAAVNLSLSAFLSDQKGATASQHGAVRLSYLRLPPNRWVYGGQGGLDQNRDLGLDLRAYLGAAAGRVILQRNQSEFLVLAGVSGNHEQPVQGEATYNGEASLGAYYTTFDYETPKLEFTGFVVVIPSLTVAGRIRLQAEVQARRELIQDFYLSLSVFESFDSKPPTQGAATNDWGPVLAIGYRF